MLVVIWRLPAADGPWLPLSLIFPVYYTLLSLYLHTRDRSIKITR
jgi:hypothetical protein